MRRYVSRSRIAVGRPRHNSRPRLNSRGTERTVRRPYRRFMLREDAPAMPEETRGGVPEETRGGVPEAT